MYNLELLAILPSRFTYDAEPFINLHTLPLSDISKSLWQNSVCGSVGDSDGYRITFQLPLMLSLFEAGARDDSETIVVSADKT